MGGKPLSIVAQNRYNNADWSRARGWVGEEQQRCTSGRQNVSFWQKITLSSPPPCKALSTFAGFCTVTRALHLHQPCLCATPALSRPAPFLHSTVVHTKARGVGGGATTTGIKKKIAPSAPDGFL